LPAALASISMQTFPALEVIVVDAGSDDGTPIIAKQFDLPIKIVESELGRGQQIATGIEAASAEWVLILHSDAELNDDSLEQIRASVRCQPDIIGGALGQRFEDEQRELLPIELLNDLRGLFTRTAFGDQTQFFHRETALREELMPKQPLMEDVESSWRTRECGGFVFLGQPTRVSHSKWKAKDWLKRFALVMRLVTRYRTARLKSRSAAKNLSSEMYQEYYGSGK
jgi:glycosyltransferase involved in cell wall biosynthesis